MGEVSERRKYGGFGREGNQQWAGRRGVLTVSKKESRESLYKSNVVQIECCTNRMLYKSNAVQIEC